MICIHLKNTDPYFCLAAEEYLLKQFSDDIFVLWQSDKTVVVGKHQNAMAEINYPFVRENNITVARRISGGGTVYHDSGNVNFSFIKNVKSPAEISFKQFTAPIIDALARLGIEATTSGRNDLLIEGLKVSGNAEHVFKKRVLHHGTLLFESDLENLGSAIKVIAGKYSSKAVQSNRSPVANISGFMDEKMPLERFIEFLIAVQLEQAQNKSYQLTEEDEVNIQELANEKFKHWEWNYGYSPKYSFQNKIAHNETLLEIELEVKKGIIQQCKLGGNYFNSERKEEISAQLNGAQHRFEIIKSVLPNESDTIIYAFF